MAEEKQKNIYGKKPLWKWILIYFVLAAIVYFAIYYFFFAKNGTSYNSTSYQNSSSQGVKFSETSDAQFAHLISTDTYDTATQAALSGFKVDRTVLADGTQQINLTAQNPEYHNQSYIVKPGQKLYFIDRFATDDQGGQEQNTTDDTAVLVDAGGYVVP